MSTLTPGSHVGHFEILAHIGHGGMGDVFKARDTRLNRIVAIKSSKAQFNERFTREARAIAALNHPNVATLYDVGPDYLVMEFVEGEPVKGPLGHDEAVRIARQIADAVEAAHDKGIIHRDLKPGNILRREDGTVKVLDFGLAKALEDDSGMSGVPGADSPTLSRDATNLGMILGTAAYMSPEQAKGKRADRRADIFSFGVVLYELLTGQRLFTGDSTTEILAAVIKEESTLDAVPAEWRVLLERCLAKDPRQRLQSIGEARILLEKGMPTSVVPPPASSSSRFSIGSAAGWVVAALALAGLAFAYLRPPASVPQRAVQLELLPPAGEATTFVQISPDGAVVAMLAKGGLWLRTLEFDEAKLIPRTEGGSYPFWSPDSGNIGFFQEGRLKRVAAAGGPVVDICPSVNTRGGTWSKDDIILFAPGLSTGLYRVPAGGGAPEIVVKPTPGAEGEFIRYPSFLPDGQHFLYQHTTPQGGGFYLGSLDGTLPRMLLPITSNAVFAPPGHGEEMGRLLFRADETLMSQPFDLDTLQLTGEMSPVVGRVGQTVHNGYGAFSASANGALVYTSATAREAQLTFFDRRATPIRTVGSPVGAPDARISPDGKHVAYALLTGARTLFLRQVAGGPSTQLVDRDVSSPRWSPAGKIVFSRTGVNYELVIKHLDGAAQEESLGVKAPSARATDWSADGKWIVYSANDNRTGDDLWLLPLGGDRKPVVFLQTPATELDAKFSPDGKWMAYVQVVSGQPEVFVQAISQAGSATGLEYPISSDGGGTPQWGPGGRELVYVSADRDVIAVPMTLGATVQRGTPHTLFKLPQSATFQDMTADAQQFLISVPVGEAAQANALTVVLNWQARLKP